MRKHAFAAKMVDEKNTQPSPFCQGKSKKKKAILSVFEENSPLIAEIID